ncbi:rhomboid family intramembrane serine protease [Flavobacterium sp. 3HN19-14]|uniref:rhomboid family intramembrane serine protease n=1 Tax=Flavobacterium sp. 3HN19-14 TaxID=3448133 RepID=UPI003EE2399C
MSILQDIKFNYRVGGLAEKLIYWNVGIFILSIPVFYNFKFGIFEYPTWLALSSSPTEVLRNPWTILTYSFLHGSFWHLFFNMLVLNFAAQLFLTYFNPKQFFGLYLLSAVFSGAVFVCGYALLQFSPQYMVGASGAIMAILVGATTYSPLRYIRLLLIGNVKLWHFTAVILLLDLLQIQLDNTGGHMAHLGGALFGFVYVKLLQNGTDMSQIVTGIIDFFANIFKPSKKTPFKKVHKNYNAPIAKRTTSKIITKDKTQQQIDEILDKISQSGYDSLTAAEKEFLFKAGK